MFPPGHADPVVLPQILTEAEMLAQLAKVSGKGVKA